MKICRNCKHYESGTFTSTGKGIAYCYEKESRRYGLPHGSIQTVTYEDSKCRFFKDGSQMSFLPEPYMEGGQE